MYSTKNIEELEINDSISHTYIIFVNNKMKTKTTCPICQI